VCKQLKKKKERITSGATSRDPSEGSQRFENIKRFAFSCCAGVLWSNVKENLTLVGSVTAFQLRLRFGDLYSLFKFSFVIRLLPIRTLPRCTLRVTFFFHFSFLDFLRIFPSDLLLNNGAWWCSRFQKCKPAINGIMTRVRDVNSGCRQRFVTSK
jgi:hypothetical protein